jgi:uncharacterized protein
VAPTSEPVFDPPVLHETHVSVVLEVGDRVYKLKKPVVTDFLDFRSREARDTVCRKEVELNRRLAPDVYLGVGTFTGLDGEPVDHVVIMRRLPAARSLERLVLTGAEPRRCLHEVAHLLATFHESAGRSEAIDEAGRPARLLENWDAGFDLLRSSPAAVDAPRVERAAHLVHEYLAGRAPLLEQRIADARVRDGHGDLQCADTFCLDDGPRVLDCIEFDDRLRHGDVLNDVAFLVMDLERLGAPHLGAALLDEWTELTADAHPASLAHHYVAYRAQVRCKVACIRHAQGRASAAGDARALLDLAIGRLEAARIPLVLVGGAPGTGKSTLSRALGDHLGWAVLRSDEVRKDLLGVGHTTRLDEAIDAGAYGAATTAATYDELLRRASTLLVHGVPVVLDASWSTGAARHAAAKVAASASSPLVALRCDLPETRARARIAGRAARGDDASDATAAVAGVVRARFEPWSDAVTVPTDAPIASLVATAADAIMSRLGRTA